VTDAISAKSTTVIISDASNASVTLEADGSVQRINLADASIKLAVTSSINKTYKVVTEPNVTPLIGLCQVQNGGLFDWTDTFKPLTSSFMSAPETTRTLENSPDVQTEQKARLFFGQVK
jgi:hypothetical protein